MEHYDYLGWVHRTEAGFQIEDADGQVLVGPGLDLSLVLRLADSMAITVSVDPAELD